MRTPLDNIQVNRNIAGRWYQEGAIKATCQAFAGNRRKALLVMATGSGKTRTVIALCDVLLRRGWVKNILFLADRNSLVTQAKRSFVNLLPDLSVTNLCEEKDNAAAHCVFSTYQTMMTASTPSTTRRANSSRWATSIWSSATKPTAPSTTNTGTSSTTSTPRWWSHRHPQGRNRQKYLRSL